VFVRYPYERQHRRSPKTDERSSWAERLLLVGLTIGGLVLPLLYTFGAHLRFADFPVSGTTRRKTTASGAVLQMCGLWLFWRSHYDLGGNWSPSLEITEQHTLVTRGVYARVRHPMDAAQALLALAQMLLPPNCLAGTGGLLMFLAFYVVRVQREEQMMREHFDEAYAAYAATTGRILPRWSQARRVSGGKRGAS